MQSTDFEEIKAALWEQASHPCTQVNWGVAQVMAVRKSRSHSRLCFFCHCPEWPVKRL